MKKRKKPILTEEEIQEIESKDFLLTICVVSLEDLKKLNLIDSRILTKYLRKSSDTENGTKKDEDW